MQQQILLKKIFKDIRIDAKMNEYCFVNKIKNDFRSINIDKFIENFVHTYPYYLSMDNVRSEITESLKTKGTRAPPRRQRSTLTEPIVEEGQSKADEYVLLKPPTSSDEFNNFIKYSF